MKLTKYNRDLVAQASHRRKLIRAMRSKDKTWADIGKMFGITPQRAQQLGKK